MLCIVVLRNGQCGIKKQFAIHIFTARNSSCGKVMFSQACVKNSVHGGAWQGGMCGRGACVMGACMAGDMHDRGACMAGGHV